MDLCSNDFKSCPRLDVNCDKCPRGRKAQNCFFKSGPHCKIIPFEKFVCTPGAYYCKDSKEHLVRRELVKKVDCKYQGQTLTDEKTCGLVPASSHRLCDPSSDRCQLVKDCSYRSTSPNTGPLCTAKRVSGVVKYCGFMKCDPKEVYCKVVYPEREYKAGKGLPPKKLSYETKIPSTPDLSEVPKLKSLIKDSMDSLIKDSLDKAANDAYDSLLYGILYGTYGATTPKGVIKDPCVKDSFGRTILKVKEDPSVNEGVVGEGVATVKDGNGNILGSFKFTNLYEEEKKVLNHKVEMSNVKAEVVKHPARRGLFLKLEFDSVDCDDNPVRVEVPEIDLSELFVDRTILNSTSQSEILVGFKALQPSGKRVYSYKRKKKAMTKSEIEKVLGYEVEIIDDNEKF